MTFFISLKLIALSRCEKMREKNNFYQIYPEKKSMQISFNKLAISLIPFLSCFVIFQISRQSIDACKDYFRDDLLKSDWALMVELKKTFQIL